MFKTVIFDAFVVDIRALLFGVIYPLCWDPLWPAIFIAPARNFFHLFVIGVRFWREYQCLALRMFFTNLFLAFPESCTAEFVRSQSLGSRIGSINAWSKIRVICHDALFKSKSTVAGIFEENIFTAQKNIYKEYSFKN